MLTVRFVPAVGLCGALLLLSAWSVFAQPAPRALCFPTQSLPAPLHAKSDELLLRVLDSEALYTVIGGLKPASVGVPSTTIKLGNPHLRHAAEVCLRMDAGSRGFDVRFTLHHHPRAFANSTPDSTLTRALAGAVFHRSSMARVIEAHPESFAPPGITSNSDPVEVPVAVEYNETPNRYRGYGLLFGYPEQAVEFFATNTPITQTRNADANTPVSANGARPMLRKFLSIPTSAHDSGAFVYAVGTDHFDDRTDAESRTRGRPLLDCYKRRRTLYIGEGRPGGAALLHDWFCKSDTDCQASNATLDEPEAAPVPPAQQEFRPHRRDAAKPQG